MKNKLRTIGIAGIVGMTMLTSSCKDDVVVSKETISGTNFISAVADLGYYGKPGKTEFIIHGISTWRNYPGAVAQMSLPRAEITEYDSGRKIVDLYFPRD